MARASLVLAVVALFVALPALADIPPPPYHGPTRAIVAGLQFDRGEGLNPPGRPGRQSFTVVKITCCRGASHNCDVITKAGVVGWGVAKIDGQWVSYGDVGAVQKAFKAGRRTPVKLTLRRIDGSSDEEREVTLDPR